MNWLRFRLNNRYIAELAAAGAVIIASLTEIAHLATTSWLSLFLYDGDSLALPIIRQSLQHKEPILWVFSSQLNLFPEGVLYAISSVFTSSISTSLLINAILNLLIFYVLVRLIFSTNQSTTGAQRRLYSLLCVLLLIIYMLLESYSQSNVADQAMATYYLFTTYYDGLLIIGLLVLYLTLLQIKRRDHFKSKKNIVLSSIVLIMSALTIASNPLYVLQFTIPLIVTIACFYIYNIVPRRKLIFLGSLQLTAFGLGIVIRHFLSSFIGQPLSSHLNFSQHTSLWSQLLGSASSLSPINPTSSTRIRLVLSVFVYFVVLFYTLIHLNRRHKNRASIKNPSIFFVLLFTTLELPVLLIPLVILHDVRDRYLIAPIILPIIGLFIIFSVPLNKIVQRHLLRIITVFIIISIVFGLISIPKIRPLVAASYPGARCLASALHQKPANGVSDYWTARALDVYGNDNIRVLQTSGLSPFAWMNNLASYENKQYSFVVINNHPEGGPTGPTLDSLGQPTQTTACPGFRVYQFSPNTQGYRRLNKLMRAGLQTGLKKRQDGRIGIF